MRRKSFIDSVRVANPCNENWDEMAGNDKVRFCSHCAKSVNNISAMTRKQAERLVRKSNGRLCVRYRVDPKTNSPLFAGRVSALARHGVAAGVLSASLLTAGAYAQSEAVPLVQIERTDKSTDPTARISGYVVDPHGAALAYALVTITNQETMVSEVQNASGEGYYEFKGLASGKYKLRFEAGGFEVLEDQNVYISEASDLRYNGQLQLLHVAASVEVSARETNADDSIQGGVTVGYLAVVETGPPNELVTAVLDNDLDEVKIRVMMRARINARDKSREGMSPLHAAAEIGSLEIAEFLLTHNAKTNIRDYEKRTPLMMLDEDATPDLFDLLVRFGAKVNLLDKQKNSVLHYFAENGVSADVLRQATNYGLNVNAVNKEGKTALMVAVENGNSDVAKALIETGADVNIRDREGRTALDMAASSTGEIASLLQTYGAVAGSR